MKFKNGLFQKLVLLPSLLIIGNLFAEPLINPVPQSTITPSPSISNHLKKKVRHKSRKKRKKPIETVPAITPSSPPISKSRLFLFVDLGGTTPLGPSDFANFWTPAFLAGAGLGIQLSNLFSTLVDFHLNTFELNLKPTAVSNTLQGYGVQYCTLTLNGKFGLSSLNSPVVPYLLAGGGGSYLASYAKLYGAKGSIIASVAAPGDLWDFLLRAGAGIDFRLDEESALFWEADGNWVINMDQIAYSQIRVGFKSKL